MLIDTGVEKSYAYDESGNKIKIYEVANSTLYSYQKEKTYTADGIAVHELLILIIVLLWVALGVDMYVESGAG